MKLRWFTLLAIVANIIFNSVYDKIFALPQIGTVSNQYNDLFTPAGYVFAIWGAIYLSFIAYGIVQLLPGNRNKPFYDQLAPYMIAANVLGSAWIVAFTGGFVVVSVVIIIATLFAGFMLFRMANNAVLYNGVNGWLVVPFSLFFGWISVATLANISYLLAANGIISAPIAFSMIIAAIIAAISVSFHRRNFIYPLVIAWAASGIWTEQQIDQRILAFTALAAIVIGIISSFIGAFRFRKLRAAYI